MFTARFSEPAQLTCEWRGDPVACDSTQVFSAPVSRQKTGCSSKLGTQFFFFFLFRVHEQWSLDSLPLRGNQKFYFLCVYFFARRESRFSGFTAESSREWKIKLLLATSATQGSPGYELKDFWRTTSGNSYPSLIKSSFTSLNCNENYLKWHPDDS